MPGTRFAVVRRPVGAVIDSLRRFGVVGLEAELERREAWLDQLTAEGAPSVRVEELNDASCCAWLFEHLTGLPFNFNWWQVASAKNIQIDVVASVAQQKTQAAQLWNLNEEMAVANKNLSQVKYTRVGREPWGSFWADAEGRVEADHLATHDGPFLGRPFKIDVEQYVELERAGRLLVCTARCNGRLFGYLIWVLNSAPQSLGTLVAIQGNWYVEPGNGWTVKRMMDWSMGALRKLGVSGLEWQHNAYGRSAGMGRHFLALGAKPHLVTYSLALEGAKPPPPGGTLE